MKSQSRLGVTVAGISPGHVAVTVNDGDTVNFTASGTDNQTITAEVIIDPAVDNITVATVDGVYTKLIDEVTYAELAALISGSDLIQGRQYLITDYQTVHYLDPNYTTAGLNTGTAEPIIVTASNVNKLEPIAYSTVHSSDILWYNPTNSWGTIQFGLPGCTKGFIYRRINTINNIDVPFDFRATTFRRYEVAVTEVWDIGTAYAQYDIVVKALGDGQAIYIATQATTGDDPAIDDGTNWVSLPFTNGSFVASKRFATMGVMGGTVPIDITSFTDYPMFNPASTYDFTLKVSTSSYALYNSIFTTAPVYNHIEVFAFHDNFIASPFVGNTIIAKDVSSDTALPYLYDGETLLYKIGFSGNKFLGSTGRFEYNTILKNFSGNMINTATTDVANNNFNMSTTHSHIQPGFDSNIIDGITRHSFLQGEGVNIKTTLDEKNLNPYTLSDRTILKTIKKTTSNFVIEELDGTNVLTYTTIV